VIESPPDGIALGDQVRVVTPGARNAAENAARPPQKKL